ncbi:MAG: hypothetical protein ACRDGV_01550 [Candidatus Limnocylindria bacterium]
MPEHRLHVLPWLRGLGRLMLSNWLAITLGRHILAWRDLTDAELAHELAHVRQWERHGLPFALRYLLAGWRAQRAGGHWYRDNEYEVEARSAVRSASVRAEPSDLQRG